MYKVYLISIMIMLFLLCGCEETTSPEDNDLPEITSLTFMQSTPCSERLGAYAVSYQNEIYLIGGCVGTSFYTTIEKLDNTNTWVELTDQMIGRRFFTAEVVNGSIYIIGGEDSNYDFVETVMAYNIDLNTITVVAPLPTKRRHLGSVVHNNLIYVIGGYSETDNAVTGVVEVYNPATNSWATASSMPTARECDVSLYENKIYAIAGYDGNEDVVAVEIYDILMDVWTTTLDLPYGLSAYHVASFENFIFMFGDYDDHIDEVHMYNTNDESFIKLTTNFTGRRHSAVVRNNEWIFVIGGYDGEEVFGLVEKCKPY